MKSNQFKRIHRVIIDSHDLYTGNIYNGKFRVSLPSTVESNDCVLMVESLLMENTTENAVCDTKYYHLHLKEVFQPLSYYSNTETSTDILATLKGREYYHYPTETTCGIPITTPSFFNNKTFSVYFTSPNFFVESVMTGDWVLTLVIYEPTESR